MSYALTSNILLHSVGKRVNDIRDKYLGEIVEIIRTPAHDAIEYIVVKSNKLFDQEDRFFAIPVSLSVIKISETGEITLLANKEELHMACGTTPERCPPPNLKLNPLIFELYEYGVSDHTAGGHTNKKNKLNVKKQRKKSIH